MTAVLSNSEPAVGEMVHAGGQARHLAGDVRDPSHVRAAVGRAVETWGRLDVAVANYSSSSVSLLPGNGDGTLGSKITLAVGGNGNASWGS